MRTRKILMGGVVAGSVGLGGLIGALVFAPGIGLAASDTDGGGRELGLCLGAAGSLDAAAEEIGIGTTELVSALRDGDTIADVARAHDVPVSDVVDAVVASEQVHLDQLVGDGRLTQAQADELSADLRERATDLVNGDLAPFPFGAGRGIAFPGIWMEPEGPIAEAADAIGIDVSDLVSSLRGGDTIADVGRAHGVPVSEVVDAVVASMQARLDAAVEDGALTRRQADALAGDLEEKASDLVNGRPAVFPGVPNVTDGDASELSVF
jgi:hypothetical protein